MTRHRAPLALAAPLAVLALAACSTAGDSIITDPPGAVPRATHQAMAAASAPAASSPSPSRSPSPVPVPTAGLTVRQARRAYVAIVHPFNRTGAVLISDFNDRVPIAQYRSDLRADAAAVRTAKARLAAVRWPARVLPYVRAMISTDLAAAIECDRALLKAHSYNRAETIGLGQACTASDNQDYAAAIRSVLGLPPPAG